MGKRPGSNFFVIDRGQWRKLLAAPTSSRLDLMVAYLVLCAGTAGRTGMTRWSATAIRKYTGTGDVRGRRAISELIGAGLVQLVLGSPRLNPTYVITPPEGESDPIFLPKQLVTGFDGEAPVLRRVRETRQFGVLALLVALYAAVVPDATYAVSPSVLRYVAEQPARKIAPMGANTVWALSFPPQPSDRYSPLVRPDGISAVLMTDGGFASVQALVSTLDTLFQVGAIRFETWLFSDAGPEAEPLFPVSAGDLLLEEGLTWLATRAGRHLARHWCEKHDPEGCSSLLFVPMLSHAPAPALLSVAKLVVESDSPGRRAAYAARLENQERWAADLAALQEGGFRRYAEPVTDAARRRRGKA